MKDDSDRLRDGTLPRNPFVDTDPIGTGAPLPTDPANESNDGFKPFPVEELPEPVRSFVLEAAAAIRCDETYVILPTLAALATAIGNTRRIQLKSSWIEPMIFWSGIVGESGTQKSPALDAPMAPLKSRQLKLLAEYEEARAEYEAQVDEHVGSRKRGSRSGSENVAGRPVPPIAKRIYCSDITIEALAKRLGLSPRGLLLLRDELSAWIAGFDQYKAKQGSDAGNWLELFRGGTLLVDRKNNDETIHIPRASLSIAGGIQPSVLRRVLGQQHVDNGLVARLLLAMPPRSPKRWSESVITQQTMFRYAGLIDELFKLDFKVNDDGEALPIDLQLTNSGQTEMIDFVNQHGIEQARRSGALAAAYSKLEGYCARLSLLIHLVRASTQDRTLESADAIDAASVRAAAAITRWFAFETERIYDVLGISASHSTGRTLLDTARDYPTGITARDVMRRLSQYRGSVADANAAMQEIVDSGLGRWDTRIPAGRGGRPTRVLVLNQNDPRPGTGTVLPVAPDPTRSHSTPCDSGDSDTTPLGLAATNGQAHV